MPVVKSKNSVTIRTTVPADSSTGAILDDWRGKIEVLAKEAGKAGKPESVLSVMIGYHVETKTKWLDPARKSGDKEAPG